MILSVPWPGIVALVSRGMSRIVAGARSGIHADEVDRVAAGDGVSGAAVVADREEEERLGGFVGEVRLADLGDREPGRAVGERQPTGGEEEPDDQCDREQGAQRCAHEGAHQEVTTGHGHPFVLVVVEVFAFAAALTPRPARVHREVEPGHLPDPGVGSEGQRADAMDLDRTVGRLGHDRQIQACAREHEGAVLVDEHRDRDRRLRSR